MRHNVLSNLFFAFQRVFSLTLLAYYGYLVGVTSKTGALIFKGIKDYEIKILTDKLVVGISLGIVCLKRKTHKTLRVRFHSTQCCRNIPVGFKSNGHVGRCTLDLLARLHSRTIIGNGSRQYGNIARRESLYCCIIHFVCRLNIYTGD